MSEFRYIGRGIYSIPEASRLARVPAARIRRWLIGYRYRVRSELRWSRPIVEPLFDPLDGELAISFLDLIEVRFVNAFIESGVSWKVLRTVYDKAVELVGHRRPFSTRRFKTDGRTIFAEITARPPATLDLAAGQMGFWAVIAPFYKDIDIDRDEVSRWWPVPNHKAVVIDPSRNFGQPIVAKYGVPTRVLYNAYAAEGKSSDAIDAVASWFQLSRLLVKAAVDFEERLAA